MAIDPAHGRDLPEGRRIASIVRRAISFIRRQSLDSVRYGQISSPDYRTLSDLVAALIPEYERAMTRGAGDAVRQIRSRRTPPPVPVNIDRAFTLYLPTVTSAARAMATEFVRDFSQTTQDYIRTAVVEGLEAGEPLTRIQARLMRVESDGTVADRVADSPAFSPKRAMTIGQTETSRAIHEGQMRYGMSVGAKGLEWLASSDACPVCLKVNGKKLPYGVPFHVWPKAPEPYKYVYHAPMHPRCFCTCVDYFEGD